MIVAECEAGRRRYAGTDVGDRYGTVLNWGTDRQRGEVSLRERTVGDLVDPYRPGSALEVVNLVTRRVGLDAAGWNVDRLVSMADGVMREARGRSGGVE